MKNTVALLMIFLMISVSMVNAEPNTKTKKTTESTKKGQDKGQKSGPSQLEIIGLVPGVSTQEEVEKAKDRYGYAIGGFSLPCSGEYIDGILSEFSCFTGKEVGSSDLTILNSPNYSYRDSLVSNVVVHAELVKGFTKKFGKPSYIENSTATNGFGTKFAVNKTTWNDKKGNRLTLMSIFTDINTGYLILKSAQQIIKDRAAKEAEDQKRKF